MKTKDKIAGKPPHEQRRIKAEDMVKAVKDRRPLKPALAGAGPAQPDAVYTTEHAGSTYTVTVTDLAAHPVLGVICRLHITGPGGPVPFSNPWLLPDPRILVPTALTIPSTDAIGRPARMTVFEENLTRAFELQALDAARHAIRSA